MRILSLASLSLLFASNAALACPDFSGKYDYIDYLAPLSRITIEQDGCKEIKMSEVDSSTPDAVDPNPDLLRFDGERRSAIDEEGITFTYETRIMGDSFALIRNYPDGKRFWDLSSLTGVSRVADQISYEYQLGAGGNIAFKNRFLKSGKSIYEVKATMKRVGR